MRSFDSRIFSTPVALFVLCAVVLGYQSLANRLGTGPTQPAIIATFDLERTFNSINQKKASDEELRKLGEHLQTSAKDMEKALKQMEAEIEDHQPGSKKHNELLDRLSEEAGYYKAFVEFSRAEIEEARARNMMDIYEAIRSTAAQIGQENKYSLVLVDDSIKDIPLGSVEEVNRQISARRMVYSADDVDITDTLIERLNQASAQPKN